MGALRHILVIPVEDHAVRVCKGYNTVFICVRNVLLGISQMKYKLIKTKLTLVPDPLIVFIVNALFLISRRNPLRRNGPSFSDNINGNMSLDANRSFTIFNSGELEGQVVIEDKEQKINEN